MEQGPGKQKFKNFQGKKKYKEEDGGRAQAQPPVYDDPNKKPKKFEGSFTMPKAPMSARPGSTKAEKWQGDKKEFKQKASFFKSKPPQTQKKYDHEFAKDSQARRHSIPAVHQKDCLSPLDTYRGLFAKLSQQFQTNQL